MGKIENFLRWLCNPIVEEFSDSFLSQLAGSAVRSFQAIRQAAEEAARLNEGIQVEIFSPEDQDMGDDLQDNVSDYSEDEEEDEEETSNGCDRHIERAVLGIWRTELERGRAHRSRERAREQAQRAREQAQRDRDRAQRSREHARERAQRGRARSERERDRSQLDRERARHRSQGNRDICLCCRSRAERDRKRADRHSHRADHHTNRADHHKERAEYHRQKADRLRVRNRDQAELAEEHAECARQRAEFLQDLALLGPDVLADWNGLGDHEVEYCHIYVDGELVASSTQMVTQLGPEQNVPKMTTSEVAALPTVQHASDGSNKVEKDSSEVRCSICLTDFKTGDEKRVLPCVHSFHVDCADKWLKMNATCPVCRLQLKE
ncbi:zinc finger CCCH domain-containing protein 13-like isoform X1 [Biomphalaria glabrata]|uniref:Zinc finger CCCH domain-containing protein 13-like isoform X1 n=1 Tax=Biomphalaria glabrata TaxID=6526 RepID=A0A9W3BP83_BIOGL|nr:zinc finger CCCH domain-containing protein 13-like isoform X1 [Biomphalaria glabrata]